MLRPSMLIRGNHTAGNKEEMPYLVIPCVSKEGKQDVSSFPRSNQTFTVKRDNMQHGSTYIRAYEHIDINVCHVYNIYSPKSLIFLFN